MSALPLGASPLLADFREENLIEGFRSSWGQLTEPAEIPLRKLQNEMTRAGQEVEAWLAGLKTSTSAGYELTQVQVLLGMSAQGSIAVVTAGLQASLTLVYNRTVSHPRFPTLASYRYHRPFPIRRAVPQEYGGSSRPKALRKPEARP